MADLGHALGQILEGARDRGRREIDEHVAAKDDGGARESVDFLCCNEVGTLKPDAHEHLRGNAPPLWDGLKIFGPQVIGEASEGTLAKDAAACLVEGGYARIAGDDFNGSALKPAGFLKGHGDR